MCDCCFVYFQSDLGALYIKAGVKNIGTVLLMTDAQVADEKFLVLVNDLLASGKLCCVSAPTGITQSSLSLPDDMHGVFCEDMAGNVKKI